MSQVWDVIVIGGGHAGCEAAHASAKMGCSTLLLTMDASKIGVMSCNPAIGGLAKGQLVREIDALGGLMGKITDQSAIQYRRLNTSKGPAVRSSRAQCDKEIYAKTMQKTLFSIEKLEIRSAEVHSVLIKNRKVQGVQLSSNEKVFAKEVVITTGTFMCAIMHTGEEKKEGGRVGEDDSRGLSRNLSELGFRLRRLKTGTPPRLKAGSIDFDQTTEQRGDERPYPFSFYNRPEPFPALNQISCYITHTNLQVHDIINKNSHRSAIYSGAIQGAGPRYCPSIEDKVRRFESRDSHLIFLEPEGLSTDSIYVNGVSTSLPKEVQEEFIRKVKGLESAEFLLFGYAVEYDAVDSRQLKRTLESKDVQGLFLAGQVNGTSGYEEAGAQGIVAGINAALEVQEKESFVLDRSEAYAGVLVDDLTLRGSDEPYRMFTSRAEHRLYLRDDNADIRLSEKGFELGLLDSASFEMFGRKKARVKALKNALKTRVFVPSPKTKAWLESLGEPELKDRAFASELLKRPGIALKDLQKLGFEHEEEPEVSEQAEIQVKYEGYIRRDRELLEAVQKRERMRLDSDLDYESVAGLSNEIKGILSQVRPETLGQASRIPGVTPAAVVNLLIHTRTIEKERPGL